MGSQGALSFEFASLGEPKSSPYKQGATYRAVDWKSKLTLKLYASDIGTLLTSQSLKFTRKENFGDDSLDFNFVRNATTGGADIEVASPKKSFKIVIKKNELEVLQILLRAAIPKLFLFDAAFDPVLDNNPTPMVSDWNGAEN